MTIEKKEFPTEGNTLSGRAINVLKNLVGDYLNNFEIKVEDHYYYSKHSIYYNLFKGFDELKNYILLKYYINYSNERGDYYKELKDLLNSHNIDASFDQNWAIRRACEKGPVHAVKMILDNPTVDPSALNSQCLYNACCKPEQKKYQKELEIAEILLKDGRVNIEPYVIIDVCRKNNSEIIKIFLKYGLDPTLNDNWLIYTAHIENAVDIAYLLIKDVRVLNTLDKKTIYKIRSYLNKNLGNRKYISHFPDK